MAAEYLFVYGTLRRANAGDMHGVLAHYGQYVATGFMQGKLYEIAGYPGAVESDSCDDRVHGEVYRILDNDLLFTLLDAYEECSAQFPQPHEYVRKILPVTIAADQKVDAWVYVFNHGINGLQQILSGDYLS